MASLGFPTAVPAHGKPPGGQANSSGNYLSMPLNLFEHYALHGIAISALTATLIATAINIYTILQPKYNLHRPLKARPLAERLIFYMAICDFAFGFNHMVDHSYYLVYREPPAHAICAALGGMNTALVIVESLLVVLTSLNAVVMTVYWRTMKCGPYDSGLLLLIAGVAVLMTSVVASFGAFGADRAWCGLSLSNIYGRFANSIFSVSLIIALLFSAICYITIWLTITSSFRKLHHNSQPSSTCSNIAVTSPGGCDFKQSTLAHPKNTIGESICDRVSLSVTDNLEQPQDDRTMGKIDNTSCVPSVTTVNNDTETIASNVCSDVNDADTKPPKSTGHYKSVWHRILRKITEEHKDYLEFDTHSNCKDTDIDLGVTVVDFNYIDTENNTVSESWSRREICDANCSDQSRVNDSDTSGETQRKFPPGNESRHGHQRPAGACRKDLGREKLERLHRTAKMMSMFVLMFALQWTCYLTYSIWDMVGTPHVSSIFLAVTFTNLGGVFNYFAYTYLRGKYLGYRQRARSSRRHRGYTIS